MKCSESDVIKTWDTPNLVSGKNVKNFGFGTPTKTLPGARISLLKPGVMVSFIDQ